MLEAQVEEGEITENDMLTSLIREGKMLAYLSPNHPRLEVINGGKDQESVEPIADTGHDNGRKSSG